MTKEMESQAPRHVADYDIYSASFVQAVFVIGRVGLVAQVEFFNEDNKDRFRLFAANRQEETSG